MVFNFGEIKNRLDGARSAQARISKLMDVPTKKAEVEDLERQSTEPGFWTDTRKAKTHSKRLDLLKKELSEFAAAGKALDDAFAHFELAHEAGDEGELKEVSEALESDPAFQKMIDTFNRDYRFRGDAKVSARGVTQSAISHRKKTAK